MGRRKDEDWTLTTDEAMRLTAVVRQLTLPGLRSRETIEALKCRAWNRDQGHLTSTPVEDVDGVRKRWER